MSIIAALGTAGDLVGLANGLRDFLAGSGFGKSKKQKIYAALASLYFTPNGLLSILREIAAGNVPERARIEAALIEFNEGEWDVQEAAQALHFDSLSAKDVPLGLRAKLQSVAYGKLSLRRDLQDALNAPTSQLEIQSAAAAQLVERIEALNDELEALDNSLR